MQKNAKNAKQNLFRLAIFVIGGETMDWQKGLNQALDYIENNLTGEIDLTIAAKYVGCSTWEFQRIFSFITQISIGEYIRRRKLTLAAESIQTSHEKIIDIALKFGYDSPAAFSRAFSQLYGVTPSLARNDGVSLKPYPKITFEFNDKGGFSDMENQSDLIKYSERGYYVQANAPVYTTKDMDKTCKWFRDVLGWYGDVIARDDSGIPMYGCVFDYPGELMDSNIAPWRGIHMFTGESIKGVAGFIHIQGLDKLYKLVKENGWNQITDIEPQAWGARECAVTTPDGCILRFFETI